MDSDSISVNRESLNRREFLAHKLLLPTIPGIIGGMIVLFADKFLEQRRRISISILALDDAEITYELGTLPFEPEIPVPTPVPSASTRFSYLITFRNDGHFSEEHIAIAFGFQGDPIPEGPLADPQVVFSTPLLREAVESPLTRQGLRDYMLRLSRLNPGDAVSVQVSWPQPMHIVAEARSEEVSAFVTQ